MSLVVAIAIIVAVTIATVAAMLFARTKAPPGARFADSDRAAGVFGVVGTAFAILLGIVVLVAYEGYTNAREHAAIEATAVLDAFESAELFPERRDALQVAHICYARAVIGQGWPTMEDGKASPIVEGWARRIDRQVEGLLVEGAKQSDGFIDLVTDRDTRNTARRERLSEASSSLPGILWALLIISCTAPILFILFWADPDEARSTQALLMGSVTALVTAAFLVVTIVDTPFSGGTGSIPPSAMRYSAKVMLAQRALEAGRRDLPCLPDGRPVGSLGA